MRQVNSLTYLKGLATFVPGVARFSCRSSSGTDSARYCYSVWMRHLVALKSSGLETRFNRVAELGPGDSIGIGLSAVLTGVDEYNAFDAKSHAVAEKNRLILEELIRLFQQREPIPDSNEFPRVSPQLEQYEFPNDILTDDILDAALHPNRLSDIRQALEQQGSGSIRIRYVAPWDESSLLEQESIDLVFSQAVMEHVQNVSSSYQALYAWLKPGGIMSHQIDYKSHGLTKDWNGHWTMSDLHWKIILGNRPYLINRHPHSAHIAMMEEAGFQIVGEQKNQLPPLPRTTLDRRYADLSDEDLQTSGSLVQAIKHVR